jgi:hypothetical protein
MIDAGIYALLVADTSVHALVGDRIYAVAGPDDAAQMPYVVYSFVGGSNEQTLRGGGVSRQRVQVDAYAIQSANCADPAGTAAAIRTAVIRALDGWQSVLSDATVLNTNLLNPGTDFCTEQRIFRCMCEFYVLYTLASS